ncbi:MAG: hypothetical protein ACUVRD_04225 [Bacteroidia bacterium]
MWQWRGKSYVRYLGQPLGALPATVYTDSLGKAYAISYADSATLRVEFWGRVHVERVNLYFSHPDARRVASWFQGYQRYLKSLGYRRMGFDTWRGENVEVFLRLQRRWGMVSFTRVP